MALRLRRGTDAERQLITPAEGELIYTTDTKSIYIGDGTTVGGIIISGEIGLGDLAEVDLSTPPTVGQVLKWDGTRFVPSDDLQGSGSGATSIFDLNDVFAFTPPDPGNILIFDGVNFVPDRIRTIFGDDSSVILDTASNTFNGTFVGDGGGLTNINLAGTTQQINVLGDLVGSVFSDSSSLIIDGVTGNVYADMLYTDAINSNQLNISSFNDAIITEVVMSTIDETNNFKFIRSSSTDISSSPLQYGRILFGRDDINGVVETISISGFQDGLAISHDPLGLHTSPSDNLIITNGVFAFGTFTPEANAKVHVEGNLYSTGYTQFGSLTSIERGALTPANGMVIYNSTTNRFQGYQNGGWINLDDGTPA